MHPSNLVIVGSTNPVKINATRQAFNQVWSQEKWSVTGIETNSGVSAQPMNDLESISGATNRAQNILKSNPTAKFGVGIEGGLQPIGDQWFDCGWIVIIDQEGVKGIGSTARIITPPKMMQRIHQGIELGHVVDEFFHTQNAKQSDGHFGLMTNNAITRTSGYVDGVIMALVRFLQPQLFE